MSYLSTDSCFAFVDYGFLQTSGRIVGTYNKITQILNMSEYVSYKKIFFFQACKSFFLS